MENTPEQQFDTDPWYAIFAGFLIIPAISTLIGFIGAIIMVIFINPFEISGFDLAFYCTDAVSIPLLLIVYYTWFRRKRIFPIFLILYFGLHTLLGLAYFIAGHGLDIFNLVMNIVWIIYFIRSQRVKVTFIK